MLQLVGVRDSPEMTPALKGVVEKQSKVQISCVWEGRGVQNTGHGRNFPFSDREIFLRDYVSISPNLNQALWICTSVKGQYLYVVRVERGEGGSGNADEVREVEWIYSMNVLLTLDKGGGVPKPKIVRTSYT